MQVRWGLVNEQGLAASKTHWRHPEIEIVAEEFSTGIGAGLDHHGKLPNHLSGLDLVYGSVRVYPSALKRIIEAGRETKISFSRLDGLPAAWFDR